MKYFLTILACIVAGFGSAQAAEQLYAATGFGGSIGELYILDPADGSVISDVGLLNDADGNNYGLTGLVYDRTTGTLYGITGSSITAPNSFVIVDPKTALVTYVGGPFSSRLSDIAIDPFTYIIYAVSGSSKYFYSVDKETGLDLKFGNTNLLPQRGGGLAADSNGVLYGTNDMTLFTYDKVTGDATGIGGTGLSAYVNALDFSETDVLYGIEGGGNVPPSGEPGLSVRQRWLVVINAATGVARELGETVGDLNALAFVPVR